MPRLLLALSLPVFAFHGLSAQAAPRFHNPAALPSPPGYSQVAEVPAGTRLIFLSGQVSLDSTGQLVGGADFRAQAMHTFRNLQAALAASGATFRDVIKLNYYVRSVANLAVLREVRDQFVNTAAPPASTLAEVSGLFRPDLLLEVEAIAVVPAKP